MSKLGGKIIAAFATFVAVLTYLAIGAAIFQAIEQDHEIEQREAYDRELSKLLDKVLINSRLVNRDKTPCFVTQTPQHKLLRTTFQSWNEGGDGITKPLVRTDKKYTISLYLLSKGEGLQRYSICC